MPLSTSPTTVPLSTHVKMEDRKRPAISSTDDIAPPSKRQAVNGGSKSKDDDVKEEAWIEVSLLSRHLFLAKLYHLSNRALQHVVTAGIGRLSPSTRPCSLCFKSPSGHSTHHFSTDARLCYHQRCKSTLPQSNILPRFTMQPDPSYIVITYIRTQSI